MKLGDQIDDPNFRKKLPKFRHGVNLRINFQKFYKSSRTSCILLFPVGGKERISFEGKYCFSSSLI